MEIHKEHIVHMHELFENESKASIRENHTDSLDRPILSKFFYYNHQKSKITINMAIITLTKQPSRSFDFLTKYSYSDLTPHPFNSFPPLENPLHYLNDFTHTHLLLSF